MEVNQMKNIVVLKNLPSNIAEEAIVVLKQNKVKLPEYSEKKEANCTLKQNPKEYILKEAEMVVSNYLSTVENKKVIQKKKDFELEKKYKRLRFFTLGLMIALLIQIIL